MFIFPPYYQADKTRNSRGDWLLRRLPQFRKTSSGFQIVLMGAVKNHSYARKTLLRFAWHSFGAFLTVGRLQIATTNDGLPDPLRICGGVFIARPALYARRAKNAAAGL